MAKKPTGQPYGRPCKFRTAEDMQTKIDQYFTECPDKKKVMLKDGSLIEVPALTISGLAYYLGFNSRSSMYEYENEGEFSDTIKKARLRIENEYEKQLSWGNATGAIFALKNFGWKDKTEHEHTGKDGEPLKIIMVGEDETTEST